GRRELPERAAAVGWQMLGRVAEHQQLAVAQEGQVGDALAHALTVPRHTEARLTPERERVGGNLARRERADGIGEAQDARAPVRAERSLEPDVEGAFTIG